MATPIILADNRFIDGTPTATDTAAGYDVLNIRDRREFTSWKAASYGTKYLSVDCGLSDFADGVYTDTDTPGVSTDTDSAGALAEVPSGNYYANTLAIKKHNLGTASAEVSVESSDDGSSWTERLAAFTPTNDKAILKTFTFTAARYWRLKIVTASVAPEIAVCMIGTRITFPVTPEAPYSPAATSVEAESTQSKTGMLLGTSVRFKPYKIMPKFNVVARSWVENYFIPFWEDYASNLAPFFYAWDLDTYPNDVRYARVPKDASLDTPVTVLAYYDSIALPMEGVRE